MTFVMKRVHASGSLKDDLRELREQARLTVEEASIMTKVLPSTIRSWERGEWLSCSSDKIYVERMVLSYVKHFKGRVSFFQKKLREELEGVRGEPVRAKILAMRPFQGFDVKWSARARVAALFVVFVFGLGFYMVAQAKAITEPPMLQILSPQNGMRLDRPVVRIEGRTQPETTVFVNERQTSIREDGTFSVDLDVPRGATEILVRAKKRHSREAQAQVRVVYERDVEDTQEL